MQQPFTSRDVVSLTGITPRQLQWWDERRISWFRLAKAVAACIPWKTSPRSLAICQLRRRGFSLQRVRKVMRFLQREFGKRLAETVSGASEYHLLTDGKTLYLETSPRQIVDILKNARQPMLTVCLTDAVRQVRADIRAKNSSAANPSRSSRKVRQAS